MKTTILFFQMMCMIGCSAYAQSFNDLFTTYKNNTTQSQQSKQNSQIQQNSGVTQYEVMDADNFFQSISPQNLQTVTGVFVYGGQLYQVKLRVGILGSNPNQKIVAAYWDGQIWNNTTSYAAPISSYSVPEQIRLACTHEAFISSLGTVYF